MSRRGSPFSGRKYILQGGEDTDLESITGIYYFNCLILEYRIKKSSGGRLGQRRALSKRGSLTFFDPSEDETDDDHTTKRVLPSTPGGSTYLKPKRKGTLFDGSDTPPKPHEKTAKKIGSAGSSAVSTIQEPVEVVVGCTQTQLPQEEVESTGDEVTTQQVEPPINMEIESGSVIDTPSEPSTPIAGMAEIKKPSKKTLQDVFKLATLNATLSFKKKELEDFEQSVRQKEAEKNNLMMSLDELTKKVTEVRKTLFTKNNEVKALVIKRNVVQMEIEGCKEKVESTKAGMDTMDLDDLDLTGSYKLTSSLDSRINYAGKSAPPPTSPCISRSPLPSSGSYGYVGGPVVPGSPFSPVGTPVPRSAPPSPSAPIEALSSSTPVLPSILPPPPSSEIIPARTALASSDAPFIMRNSSSLVGNVFNHSIFQSQGRRRPVVTLRNSEQDMRRVVASVKKRAGRANITNLKRPSTSLFEDDKTRMPLTRFNAPTPLDAAVITNSGINMSLVEQNDIFRDKYTYDSKVKLVEQTADQELLHAPPNLDELQCLSGFAPQIVEKKSSSSVVSYPIFENLGYVNLTPTHKTLVMNEWRKKSLETPLILSWKDFYSQFATLNWDAIQLGIMNYKNDWVTNYHNQPCHQDGSFFWSLFSGIVATWFAEIPPVLDAKITIQAISAGIPLETMISFPYFIPPQPSHFMVEMTGAELDANPHLRAFNTYKDANATEKYTVFRLIEPWKILTQEEIDAVPNDTTVGVNPFLLPGVFTNQDLGNKDLIITIFQVYLSYSKFYNFVDHYALAHVCDSLRYCIDNSIAVLNDVNNPVEPAGAMERRSRIDENEYILTQINSVWKALMAPFSINGRKGFVVGENSRFTICEDEVYDITYDDISLSLLYLYARRTAIMHNFLQSDGDLQTIFTVDPSIPSIIPNLTQLTFTITDAYTDEETKRNWIKKYDEIIIHMLGRKLQVTHHLPIIQNKRILDFIFNHPLVIAFVKGFLGPDIHKQVSFLHGIPSLINLQTFPIFYDMLFTTYKRAIIPKKKVWFVLNGFKEYGVFPEDKEYERLYTEFNQHYMNQIHPVFTNVVVDHFNISQTKGSTNASVPPLLPDNPLPSSSSIQQNILLNIFHSHMKPLSNIGFLDQMFVVKKNLTLSQYCDRTLTNNTGPVMQSVFLSMNIQDYDSTLSLNSFRIFISKKHMRGISPEGVEQIGEIASQWTPESDPIPLVKQFVKVARNRGRPLKEPEVITQDDVLVNNGEKILSISLEQYRILVDRRAEYEFEITLDQHIVLERMQEVEGTFVKAYTSFKLFIQNKLEVCKQFRRNFTAELCLANHLQHPYHLLRTPRTAATNGKIVRMPATVPPYPLLNTIARREVRMDLARCLDKLSGNSQHFSLHYKEGEELEEMKTYIVDLKNPSIEDTLLPVNGWHPSVIQRIERTSPALSWDSPYDLIYASPKLTEEDFGKACCIDCHGEFRLKTTKRAEINGDNTQSTLGKSIDDAKKRNNTPCAGYIPCSCKTIQRCVVCYVSRWLYTISELYPLREMRIQFLQRLEEDPNKLKELLNTPFQCPGCKEKCYIGNMYIISFDDLLSWLEDKPKIVPGSVVGHQVQEIAPPKDTRQATSSGVVNSRRGRGGRRGGRGRGRGNQQERPSAKKTSTRKTTTENITTETQGSEADESSRPFKRRRVDTGPKQDAAVTPRMVRSVAGLLVPVRHTERRQPRQVPSEPAKQVLEAMVVEEHIAETEVIDSNTNQVENVETDNNAPIPLLTAEDLTDNWSLFTLETVDDILNDQ